jgi:hypothetical protein
MRLAPKGVAQPRKTGGRRMKVESIEQIAESAALWQEYTELDNFNELTLQERIEFLDVLFHYEAQDENI